jgi:hypothetical protein
MELETICRKETKKNRLEWKFHSLSNERLEPVFSLKSGYDKNFFLAIALKKFNAERHIGLWVYFMWHR